MSLATRCTSCGTVFRVVQDQLKVSEGWVRCGRCDEVFNALEGLFDLGRDSPPEGGGGEGAATRADRIDAAFAIDAAVTVDARADERRESERRDVDIDVEEDSTASTPGSPMATSTAAPASTPSPAPSWSAPSTAALPAPA